MTTTLSIIDDHRLVRDGLVAACLATGRITVCFEGDRVADAVAVSPPADVVLLDLDLHGEEVTAADVEQLLQVGSRVILVSATTKGSLVLELLRVGVSGFVSKQDPTELLIEAIDAVVAGDSWTTPELAALIAGDPERPLLSSQEVVALQLYASGLKLESVARKMGVAPTTVREYINRIRAKYEAVGRPAPTKVDLHQVATRDGYLNE